MYGMVCGNVYVNFMVFMALPWAMVGFTCGEAGVSWRSCSHVQATFTSRGTVTCMFRSYTVCTAPVHSGQ